MPCFLKIKYTALREGRKEGRSPGLAGSSLGGSYRLLLLFPPSGDTHTGQEGSQVGVAGSAAIEGQIE